MSDLTGPRFESQIFRSRDERVTVRPTGRLTQMTQSLKIKILQQLFQKRQINLIKFFAAHTHLNDMSIHFD